MKHKWMMIFSSLILNLVLMTACGPMNNDNKDPADQTPPTEENIDNQRNNIDDQQDLERNDQNDIHEENMNNHRDNLDDGNDRNNEYQNKERNKELEPNNRNMNDQRA